MKIVLYMSLQSVHLITLCFVSLVSLIIIEQPTYKTAYSSGPQVVFSNRVIESWNQIPTQVKNVKTVSSFKHGYKTYRAGLVPPT
jgi:hypothetical protein